MDWFLCPDWGIGAPSITVYLDEQYNLDNTNIFDLPFVFADDSLQSSCDSLSTVTISGGPFYGSYYRTIHILVDISQYSFIQSVHVGEVRFIGIDSPTCTRPTPSVSLPPPEQSPSSPLVTPSLRFFSSFCELGFCFGLKLKASFFHPCCRWLSTQQLYQKCLFFVSLSLHNACAVCLYTLCAICLLVAMYWYKRSGSTATLHVFSFIFAVYMGSCRYQQTF